MLSIQNLSKEFSGKLILNTISATLEMGTIVALLGPSGSGKTTLLRCLSRLEKSTSGGVSFGGTPMAEVQPTDIGMVFQGFHLFPHLTILENIVFAPKKVLKLSNKQACEKALFLLENFGLKNKENKYPSQLSGGQKQRVSIIRTLIMDPKLILFDEPTSALDPELVQETADLIGSLLSPHRLMVMATHDLRFVKRIANQILFLDQGTLVENCSASSFFTQPQSEKGKFFIEKMQ